MAVHVAILRRAYLRLIIDGVKTVESRLTKHVLAPYQKIKTGDRIYFKASSGPYMATAVADRVVFESDLTSKRVEELRRRYNKVICGEREYWEMKRMSRYATLVWLKNVEAVDVGPRMKPSRGLAWFVMEERSVEIGRQGQLREGADLGACSQP